MPGEKVIQAYPKSRTIRPRAFYVRMVTGLIPIMAVYGLMVSNFLKALAFVESVSNISTWGRVSFSVLYSALLVFTLYILSVMLKRWIWDTVYIVIGTVRFKGLVGTKVPAGLRLSDDGDVEFITTTETVVDKTGVADCEVCVRWSVVHRDGPCNKV